MSKKALVLIADGTEEMECVITVDILRRAGVEVTLAGLSSNQATTCSRQVTIVPDCDLLEARTRGPYDAVVLPGGLAGARAFCESKELGECLKEQEEAGRIVGAICAAPTALKAHAVGLGKSVTSYPSVKEEMMQDNTYDYRTEEVIVDENITTSRGPGTAIAFALSLAEQLMGKEKAKDVANAMLVCL